MRSNRFNNFAISNVNTPTAHLFKGIFPETTPRDCSPLRFKQPPIIMDTLDEFQKIENMC